MIIEQPARFLRWIYPHAVWRMNPSSKVIYLTFDDGPIPEATPFVLDTLAHYGIHATFFVVGDNVRKYPDIFRQIVEAGHRVGNHTYNHIGGLRWLSKNYLANTRKAQQIIELNTPHSSLTPAPAGRAGERLPHSSLTPAPTGRAGERLPHSSLTPAPTGRAGEGLPPPLFRPPHGWMRPLQYRIIRGNGYKIIMWDLVTRDYSRRLTADDVLQNVKRYTRNGSIITFHDSLRSIDKLHKMLPEALEWLIHEGYTFGTL